MKLHERKILSLEKKLQKVKEAAERKAKRLEKRALLMKNKPPGIKKLKADLRKVTHAIVRLSYDNCYTCDKFVPLKERQCGHYHTDGGNPGTRYDFDNLRVQHAVCNYHSGGDAHFGARLLKEIGEERFLALDMKRKIDPGWTKDDYLRLIEERKQILHDLEKTL